MVYLIPKGDKENRDYDDLEIKLHLNIGFADMQLKNYRSAIKEHFNFVLKKEKGNPKALYRKAKCFMLLDDYNECDNVFEIIKEEIGSDDREFNKLKKQLEDRRRKYMNSKLNLSKD